MGADRIRYDIVCFSSYTFLYKDMHMAIKKLIEVALPLEKINSESAREKSIRHGHPSTLHLWWARRPLAAARAVIWASLVDDPSSHPEQFPTEEAQEEERKRLFKILEDLVVWENSNNEKVLAAAKAEIMKSTNGNPPPLLDPFAGGGAIPLEAQRLGLEAHAHDLNPVAVMINKAMIEIPPRFAGMKPVNPISRSQIHSDDDYKNARGLAEDIRYYGEWMKKEAFKRIGHLYPTVKIQTNTGEKDANVIAWIWARTVKCPNPACGCEMPLAKTFILISNNSKQKIIHLHFNDGKVSFTIKDYGHSLENGTVNRKGAICACCGTPVNFAYIREECKAKRSSAKMMAIIAEGEHGRIYFSPTDEHIEKANIPRPSSINLGQLAYYPGYINPVAYGFNNIDELFTNRQLLMLETMVDILASVKIKIEKDAILANIDNSKIPLAKNGKGALAYSDAICVYLAFAIDKLTDYNSSICSWLSTGETIAHSFGMTGMAMRWDYCEANPFSSSTGCWDNMISMVSNSISICPTEGLGVAIQQDAKCIVGCDNMAISTDPPYYNNVPYADFSDFFYVWLRKCLHEIYPELFSTMLTPKNDELVADPYRAGGKEKAADYFEHGMLKTCCQIYKYSNPYIPITIYYAYKQSETEIVDTVTNTVSTGWEKMLTAITFSGLTITGTWPIRTERASTM